MWWDPGAGSRRFTGFLEPARSGGDQGFTSGGANDRWGPPWIKKAGAGKQFTVCCLRRSYPGSQSGYFALFQPGKKRAPSGRGTTLADPPLRPHRFTGPCLFRRRLGVVLLLVVRSGEAPFYWARCPLLPAARSPLASIFLPLFFYCTRHVPDTSGIKPSTHALFLFSPLRILPYPTPTLKLPRL